MNVSTRLQRDLLYVVADGDATTEGTLTRALETYYRTDLRPDRLSANLDALRESGLIERIDTDRTPRYGLTDRGRREIVARREWESRYFDPDGKEG